MSKKKRIYRTKTISNGTVYQSAKTTEWTVTADSLEEAIKKTKTAAKKAGVVVRRVTSAVEDGELDA